MARRERSLLTPCEVPAILAADQGRSLNKSRISSVLMVVCHRKESRSVQKVLAASAAAHPHAVQPSQMGSLPVLSRSVAWAAPPFPPRLLGLALEDEVRQPGSRSCVLRCRQVRICKGACQGSSSGTSVWVSYFSFQPVQVMRSQPARRATSLVCFLHLLAPLARSAGCSSGAWLMHNCEMRPSAPVQDSGRRLRREI